MPKFKFLVILVTLQPCNKIILVNHYQRLNVKNLKTDNFNFIKTDLYQLYCI